MSDRFLSRQTEIVPREVGDLTVAIVGVGGIGSNLADNLASIGVSSFILIDPDRVAEENVYPGRFSVRDVGRPKVEAVEEHLIIDFEVADVVTFDRRVQEIDFNSLPHFEVGIACADNMEARREALTQALMAEREPDMWIDARMGNTGYTILSFLLGDEDALTRYNMHEGQDENVELLCGEKATAMITKGAIPYFVATNIRKFALGEPFDYIISGDAARPGRITASPAVMPTT